MERTREDDDKPEEWRETYDLLLARDPGLLLLLAADDDDDDDDDDGCCCLLPPAWRPPGEPPQPGESRGAKAFASLFVDVCALVVYDDDEDDFLWCRGAPGAPPGPGVHLGHRDINSL